MAWNKYNAKAVDGFPSKLERSVYQILLLREKAKEITDIRRQVRVELTDAKIASKVDFSFTDLASQETVFCEAKGVETERFGIFKKLWKHYGTSKMEIWKGTYLRPKLIEVIVPKQTEENSL